MKRFCLKVSNVLKEVYSYGIIICLFGSSLTIIGFIVAFCIGGETASLICEFIYKKIFYYLILSSSFIILIGLVSIYFSGDNKILKNRNK